MKASTAGAAVMLLAVALPGGARAACEVSSIALHLGSLATGEPARHDSVGRLSVTCSGPAGSRVRYRLSLTAGGSGDFQQRRMIARVRPGFAYNLYADAARTLVWGDGTNGTVVVSDDYVLAAPRMTRNYPVYGRIFGSRLITEGPYADSVLVTLDE